MTWSTFTLNQETCGKPRHSVGSSHDLSNEKKKKKGICKKCLLDRQRAYIVYGLYNLTTPEFPPVKENWALKSQEKSNKSCNPSQDSHKRSWRQKRWNVSLRPSVWTGNSAESLFRTVLLVFTSLAQNCKCKSDRPAVDRQLRCRPWTIMSLDLAHSTMLLLIQNHLKTLSY